MQFKVLGLGMASEKRNQSDANIEQKLNAKNQRRQHAKQS